MARWAATVCAAFAAGARSLIAGPLVTGGEVEDGEQEEPTDDCHVLQAGRQFVRELASAAEPEAMPDQSGGNRKAGQQQRTQPCEESGGDKASADELGKGRGARESRRPRQSVAPDFFDARPPMPQLIDPAIKKHGRKTKPGDQEPVLNHPFSLPCAAIKCLTAGVPSAWKLCTASCSTRSALVTR